MNSGLCRCGDALVAKVVADLIDPVEPAHDEPLEVELVRDAQVEGAIQRVVMGGKGTRRGAAIDRLKHRRLDLSKAPLVQQSPDG